ncbi:MAG: hypothetical protein QOD30_692 [Actinomycetota bacterium]|nr:hypothetical protein [Actinomycetota bacterium]
MRRIGALLLAVALLGACGGGGGNDDDTSHTTPTIGRAGSTAVTTTAHVVIGAPPDTYEVHYRIEEVHRGRSETSTARLLVDAPFRSRLEIRRSTALVSLRVADLHYLGTRTTSGANVLTPSPRPAVDAVRADLVLHDESGDVRSVAGRECEMHQLGAPLLDNDGTYVAGDSVDVCVDHDGLVLEQLERVDGVLTRRWIATAVDATAVVTDDDVHLAGVAARAAKDGGGSVQAIEPSSAPPGSFWQLDAPPAGFTRVGRYAVVPPQGARPDDENTRSQVLAGIVDVFVRGSDVLVIDQGGTLGQVPPPLPTVTGSAGVDLGALAKAAESYAMPWGAEVRALLPPGRYVLVSGTLPSGDLIAVARQLHEIQGQGITYR